eukprot:m.285984 g.285984  ORF g.285984 m.285984 type:complete len:64 (+) comp40687_c1_seq6:1376-1567(+)
MMKDMASLGSASELEVLFLTKGFLYCPLSTISFLASNVSRTFFRQLLAWIDDQLTLAKRSCFP